VNGSTSVEINLTFSSFNMWDLVFNGMTNDIACNITNIEFQ
jgi:hypothetical protein